MVQSVPPIIPENRRRTCGSANGPSEFEFVATDKGHHAESIKGMLPEGAAAFVGKNGEDVAIKFDQAGNYGVKCTPHYGMGMVAMVVVGTPANEEQARAVPQTGKAKQAFAVLFEKFAATKTAAK